MTGNLLALPMPGLATCLRWAAGALIFAAYLIFAHVSTASGEPTFAGAIVAIGPVIAFALVVAWRSPHRWLALTALAAGCLTMGVYWEFLERNFSWIYFLQNAGTNALLGAVFTASLQPGRTPVCSQLAEVVHPEGVPASVMTYTRRVTIAWAAFFIISAAVSIALFFFGPIEFWSVFANLLAMPLVGVMFLAEYLVRLRVLPPEHRPGLVETVRAYIHSKRATPRR